MARKCENSGNAWKVVKLLCETTIQSSIFVAVLASATLSDAAAASVASDDEVPEALSEIRSKESPKAQKILVEVFRSDPKNIRAPLLLNSQIHIFHEQFC